MTTTVFDQLYHEELYNLPSLTLIVTDREWDIYTEDEKTLLQKILGSVKLGFSTVQVVHTTNLDSKVLRAYQPSRVISFGVPVTSVPTTYQLANVDGIPVICADSLSNLDDGRKKNLWLALRQMFSI